jgi:hypothetical protein
LGQVIGGPRSTCGLFFLRWTWAKLLAEMSVQTLSRLTEVYFLPYL